MSSSLSQNLAAQTVARNASESRRRKVMDAVMAMAKNQQDQTLPGATLLPDSPAAASTAPPAAIPGGASSLAPSNGGFNPQFNSELQRLLNDYKGQVSVSSGYRSPQRQAQLFAQAVKKYGSEAAARKWVAPPGHSKHNEGLAADLHFSNDAVRQKIHQVAANYGLTFPMAYESWHIEPIGARKK